MKFEWRGKSEDGETIVLKRLKAPLQFQSPTPAPDQIRKGMVLDVETSGLNPAQDQIIEIGIVLFTFNRETGAVLEVKETYASFNDPKVPLSQEIIELTGITDEMVKGQAIDWTKVGALINDSQLIIAHNASFDRAFIDLKSPESKTKIWGCSLKQIDWSKKGFPSQKLEILNLYHGFFIDSHRALQDSLALLHLLHFEDSESKTPYLNELLKEARTKSVKIQAFGASFDSKEKLKDRNYKWDAENRVWTKEVGPSFVEEELKALEEQVYLGPFRGKTTDIEPHERFKR